MFEDSVRIGKIVCLARTYKKHAEEMKTSITKDPLLFLKPSSAVIFDGDSIVIPSRSKCVHHEVELGVVIGKNCKNINKDDALDYVLGYLIGLDITARDIQSEAKQKGWPWSISKGFDTFAPISEIVLKNEVIDPNNLNFSLDLTCILQPLPYPSTLKKYGSTFSVPPNSLKPKINVDPSKSPAAVSVTLISCAPKLSIKNLISKSMASPR